MSVQLIHFNQFFIEFLYVKRLPWDCPFFIPTDRVPSASNTAFLASSSLKTCISGAAFL